jgi:CheY-like chemotaxis protein
VAVASTGSEALRRASEVQPDVALVDIDLGPECGFDVAQRLAGAANANPSPVILISAYPQREFADLIEASPAIGFVSKPHLSARAIRELLAGNLDVGPA